MLNNFEHNGIRWGYSFLLTGSRLPYNDKLGLLYQATEMYLTGETERQVENSDSYEGMLHTERKYEVLGYFAGQRFDAELNTDNGKVHLRFLVSELTGGKGMAYTQN